MTIPAVFPKTFAAILFASRTVGCSSVYMSIWRCNFQTKQIISIPCLQPFRQYNLPFIKSPT